MVTTRLSWRLTLVGILWLALQLSPCPAWADVVEVPRKLSACDDMSEYPPLVFYRRDGGRKTEDIIGFSIDYLRQILAETHREVSIELLPWQRCLNAAAGGDYDLALTASKTPERDRAFQFTQTYYAIHQVLYFSRARPKPVLDSPVALRRLHLCGRNGYTYGGFGVDDAIVDRGARTLDAAAEMLRLGRCDVLMGDMEITVGQDLIEGRDILPETEFGVDFPAYALPDALNMAVSRAVPYHDELVALLSNGITEMEKSGRVAPLVERYFKAPGTR